MADRGVIFSAAMVLALLGGRKTQTRRLIKPELVQGARFQGIDRDGQWLFTKGPHFGKIKPPYAVGDRLYVREGIERANEEAVGFPADGSWFPNTPWRWKPRSLPGRYMPRDISRLWLNVTDVRVQRLQDISEEDAIAEGLFWDVPTEADQREWRDSYADEYGDDPLRPVWTIPGTDCGFGPKPRQPIWGATAKSAFQFLWDSLHTKPGETWEDNPWICVVSFEVNHGNIDACGATLRTEAEKAA